MEQNMDRLLGFLSKPLILFYTLPWLLCVLVIGTVAQRYIGIYEAERLFFSSFVIWLGPLPLPGMYPILALLGLSLTAKLILKSPWTRKTSGTVITHMGALLLLVGGLLTAVTSEEGFITLGPDETVSMISDYHQRELVVLKNDERWQAWPRESLAAGQVIDDTALPFTMTIEALCRHCEPRARRDAGDQYLGAAKNIALVSIPLRKEDEENLLGVTFRVAGVDAAQDGVYMAFEAAGKQPELLVGKDRYRVMVGKTQRPLPFSVRLESFDKYSYPGTKMAQEYQSVVSVMDGEVEWQSPIRMNEPLRYRGYTLYQSSFIQADGKEYSVLAVVKNAGRVFPYVSSMVMCIGLLIHLVMRRRKRVAV